MRITSQRVAPSARAASICSRGVWANTSRVTAVMIGRIISASTNDAVNTVPGEVTWVLPNSGNQPRWACIQCATGCRAGPSTLIPHSPKITDGTAASRSMTNPIHREKRPPTYWVNSSAIPIATGTATSSAITEDNTVVHSSAATPKCGGREEESKVVEVKKFAVLSSSGCQALPSRNAPMMSTTTTMIRLEARAEPPNSRSPR